MISIRKFILYILFIISLLCLMLVFVLNKNISESKYLNVIGKITYIKKSNDKVVFDIKSNRKYRVTVYEKFNYNLGDKVLLSGDFKTPDNNTMFNLFNYRKY